MVVYLLEVLLLGFLEVLVCIASVFSEGRPELSIGPAFPIPPAPPVDPLAASLASTTTLLTPIKLLVAPSAVAVPISPSPVELLKFEFWEKLSEIRFG